MTEFTRRALIAATSAGAAAAAFPAFALADQNAALRSLLDQFFEAQLDDSPERVTQLGLDKGPRAAAKSQLDDYSAAGKAARLGKARARI